MIAATAKPQSARIDAAAMAEFIDRMHAACLTVNCLPGDGPKGFFSTWPAYRHTWWDWGNEVSMRSDADIARRLLTPPDFTPTPRQVTECLPLLALLNGVERETRMIIAMRAKQEWWMASGLPAFGGWRAIASVVGKSDWTCRNYHYETMRKAFFAMPEGSL
ncbi:MAG TPA: hypothetical protein VG735_07955 [Caulobacterales bacterium]|nr:hypothetical protein [Caulobacterales bacterium]